MPHRLVEALVGSDHKDVAMASGNAPETFNKKEGSDMLYNGNSYRLR
ncbi:hypothetical protein ACFQ1M_07725 [Sungkyunkwania multivorans]|uniref:Uncharacterized protein n=1 Tax=Sungkyunkwania multivorans TaxID=1173618 RepID=A0ABW3CWG4_9FLAO